MRTSIMDIYSSLYVNVVAILFSWLLSMSYGEDQCSKSNIKDALHRCNADLSLINNAVLSATSQNYSQVCSAFSSYIQCVDPRIVPCRSTMLKRYKHTRTIYSRPPYNCTIPSPITIDSRNADKASSDGQAGGSDKRTSYGFVINSSSPLRFHYFSSSKVFYTCYLSVMVILSYLSFC